MVIQEKASNTKYRGLYLTIVYYLGILDTVKAKTIAKIRLIKNRPLVRGNFCFSLLKTKRFYSFFLS